MSAFIIVSTGKPKIACHCRRQRSRDKQGQSRDKAVTNSDKQGQTRKFPFCSCLSLSVPVCPCMYLIVLVCPCLSLYVSTFVIPSCLPMQMNITVFISINIVTLTFIAKATAPMHAKLVFNFLFTFHLASSTPLSFNQNSSILVINITKGFTWFLSSLVFSV